MTKNIEIIKNKHIYVARIILEAETILSIGSDKKEYDQDSPVAKDFNGIPYIPGTAIAGFLRRHIKDSKIIMGDDKEDNNDSPKGSYISIGDALLYNGKKVYEEATPRSELLKDKFWFSYLHLPLRQHTAINERGSAKEHSKHDTEFVYKGSRFMVEFSLEIKSDKTDKQIDELTTQWEEALACLNRNDFYLGAGETNDSGLLKAVEIKECQFNLDDNYQLNYYNSFSANLNDKLPTCFKTINKFETTKDYDTKSLTLSGKNSFFHFGAGMGSDKADDICYKEMVVKWNGNKPEFKEYAVLPGSSLKGTIAHRVAYHSNIDNQIFVESLIENKLEPADITQFENKLPNNIYELNLYKKSLTNILNNIDNIDVQELFNPHLGSNNVDVLEIFGSAKNSNSNNKGRVGNLIVQDIYIKDEDYKEIVMYHNKIDRFTSGTIDTALFSEEVLQLASIKFTFKYKNEAWSNNALKETIKDLKAGRLAIGGKNSKGHGIFANLEIIEDEK